MKDKVVKEKKVKVRKKLSSKAKKIIVLGCFCKSFLCFLSRTPFIQRYIPPGHFLGVFSVVL